MSPVLSFILLLLSLSVALEASFTTSVLPAKQAAPSGPVASISTPVYNITLAYRGLTDDKPTPLTDGHVCTRNAGCARNAASNECGMPPYMRRPNCFRTKPSATLCCGKVHGKDHPCTIFWPESHAKCADEMKNHDCHRAFGTDEFCEPIKTHEPPDQCALKAHCAGKTFEKRCSKWYQRLVHPHRCERMPDYKSCCLPWWNLKPRYKVNIVNSACKENWPKDLKDCGKGCKVQQGGKVTCPVGKRDIALAKTTLLPSVVTSIPKGPTAAGGIKKDSPEERKYHRTSCAFGALCAHLVWQEKCNQDDMQKLKPYCWSDAPQLRTCCDAEGRVARTCRNWMDHIIERCEARIGVRDCKNDKEGFKCKLKPPMPAMIRQPSPNPMNATSDKREGRRWIDGDPIPLVTDCRHGTRCALASWKTSCDKWQQKFNPGCWQRAPAYHTCCNARGERKPPHNDACKVRWPTNEMWCQDILRAWDCKDDAKGKLVCEKREGIPAVTAGN